MKDCTIGSGGDTGTAITLTGSVQNMTMKNCNITSVTDDIHRLFVYNSFVYHDISAQ